jgi:hypothetical protein
LLKQALLKQALLEQALLEQTLLEQAASPIARLWSGRRPPRRKGRFQP